MKNKQRTPMLLTALVLLAVLLVIAFAVGLSWGSRSDHQTITSHVLDQRLQEIGELATVEYHYTNMGKFENQLDFYGWAVPLTKKSFIVSYDGMIKAGVDVSQVTSVVYQNEVVINLPEPQILSHEIDFGTLTVYDESRNIFNPIRITDYQQFSLDQQAQMEQRVTEAGLLEEARTKAERAMTQLVHLLPSADELTVTVHWAK